MVPVVAVAGHDAISLAQLLRARKAEILDAWEREVAPLLVGRHLPRPALRDHMPDLIDRLAERVEAAARGGPPTMPPREPEIHAMQRVQQGYSSAQIVAEYAALRHCIHHFVNTAEQHGMLPIVNRLIDEATVWAIERATEAQARILTAVDALFSAAHQSGTMDELLEQVIRVVLEVTTTAHTAAVLLREGDVLRVRAAFGLEREVELGLEVPIGVGFAGRVAAENQPVLLERACERPELVSQVIRKKGVLGLYGVPLHRDHEVIGVAHMGSLTATDFPETDKLVFRILADRAAVALAEHLLREDLATARAEAEEAHAELSALFDAVPVGLALFDRDLRFRRVSRQLAEWDGVRADAHLGRRVDEIVRPDTAAEVAPMLRRVLDTSEPIPATELALLRDGRERLYQLSVAPVRWGDAVTGVGAVILDLTERRRIERELERSERRLRATFDFAAVGLAEVAPNGRWLRLNARYCEILGYPEHELRKIGFQDVTHPDDLEEDQRALNRLLAGETPSYTIQKRYVRRDGGVVWVEITVGLVRDARGEPEYMVVAAEDISERRRITEELERAIRRRDEILAVVSHDLRNPLATISLSEAVMLRSAGGAGVSDDAARRHAQRVLRSAEHMERIIADLLDAAAVDKGHLQVTLAEEDADALCEEAVESALPMVHERALTLEVRAASHTMVMADRQRVVQVLSNLLGNAIKFTQPGGRIEVLVEAREREAVFTVSDTGPGMTSEELERAFDRYWQAPKPAARRGVGLGLSIAKAVVLAHGGRIWAESTPGQGSAFHFTLPLAP